MENGLFVRFLQRWWVDLIIIQTPGQAFRSFTSSVFLFFIQPIPLVISDLNKVKKKFQLRMYPKMTMSVEGDIKAKKKIMSNLP